MWHHCEKVITPTVAFLVNDFIDENPTGPSFTELIPIFKIDNSGA
ncbi:MAG: hypothetical protein ACJA09_000377 [Alcanivorax sp.]|jgi:hypothetical protein